MRKRPFSKVKWPPTRDQKVTLNHLVHMECLGMEWSSRWGVATRICFPIIFPIKNLIPTPGGSGREWQQRTDALSKSISPCLRWVLPYNQKRVNRKSQQKIVSVPSNLTWKRIRGYRGDSDVFFEAITPPKFNENFPWKNGGKGRLILSYWVSVTFQGILLLNFGGVTDFQPFHSLLPHPSRTIYRPQKLERQFVLDCLGNQHWRGALEMMFWFKPNTDFKPNIKKGVT